MDRCTTRAEFCQAVQTMTRRSRVAVDNAGRRRPRGRGRVAAQVGGAWLRRALGVALSARAERLGVSETCACGHAVTFRQRRPTRMHTVLPGRDVEATVLYGQCRVCQRGTWPVLRELGVDAEGFTRVSMTSRIAWTRRRGAY